MAVSENVNIDDPDRTAIVQSVINSGPTGIDLVVDFLNTDFTSLQSTYVITCIIGVTIKLLIEFQLKSFKS